MTQPIMNEVVHSDVVHLVRLRLVLDIFRGVIPFGTLKDADLVSVTRTVAEWVADLERAVGGYTGDEDALADGADPSPVWDGWIPVAHRLPEDGERVLIAYDGSVSVGNCDRYQGGAEWSDDMCVGGGMVVQNVTHWRPIPGVPRG